MEVTHVNSIVIYTSHFGNTKQVAEAIADGLRTRGTAQVFSVDEVSRGLPPETDLVVIGGPTEAHKMTGPMAHFFEHLAPDTLRDMAAAAFDTRLRWPRWVSGSAGAGIEKKLEAAGARVIAPVESFFIKGAMGTGGSSSAQLEDGELEHAKTWATSLAERRAWRSSAGFKSLSGCYSEVPRSALANAGLVRCRGPRLHTRDLLWARPAPAARKASCRTGTFSPALAVGKRLILCHHKPRLHALAHRFFVTA
jgi:flavodoxin